MIDPFRESLLTGTVGDLGRLAKVVAFTQF